MKQKSSTSLRAAFGVISQKKLDDDNDDDDDDNAGGKIIMNLFS